MQEVQSGNVSAHQLIGHAESLLLALDAVTRELDEPLPHALGRITAHGQTTQTALSQLRPLPDASELVAQSTVSHVHPVQARKSAVLVKNVSVRVDYSGRRLIQQKIQISNIT